MLRKFSAAVRRVLRRLLGVARSSPARVRALVLAVLVLVSMYVPGLPVDQLDAVVAAALVLAAGETGHRRGRAREDASEPL